MITRESTRLVREPVGRDGVGAMLVLQLLDLLFILVLCGTYTIANPSPSTHETRGLSCDPDDAIDAKRHREDAIAAITSR